MSKDSKDETPVKPTAAKLLMEFLDKNKMGFRVKRQSVRYVEDDGMIIEPPTVVVYYKDDLKNG